MPTVMVTQEDLDTGLVHSPDRNALAVAVKRAFGAAKVTIRGETIRVWQNSVQGLPTKYTIPAAIADWVDEYESQNARNSLNSLEPERGELRRESRTAQFHEDEIYAGDAETLKSTHPLIITPTTFLLS